MATFSVRGVLPSSSVFLCIGLGSGISQGALMVAAGSSSGPMAAPAGACNCLHCKKSFVPEPRNRHHQRFCLEPACRKASKRDSQRRWLRRPENQNYFRDAQHVARVQAWRRQHPGYWKRRTKMPSPALQDLCPTQSPLAQPVAKPDPSDLSKRALQDLCQAQLPLLVGLISQWLDSPLQEDIVPFARRLIAKGQDLLDSPSRRSAPPHGPQTTPSSGPPSHRPAPL